MELNEIRRFHLTPLIIWDLCHSPFFILAEISKMSERDNLEIPTDLEGKLFLTFNQRQKLLSQAAFC